jgi:hypothetical protein
MMALFSSPHSLSFHPPFSSKASHPVKMVSDSVIFILGYLFRGLVSTMIKKSMLKFAAVAVWNAWLIYYYISPTAKSVNRIIRPTRMWKATRLEVAIPIATKIESTIQTGVFNLWLSVAVTGINDVVRLSNHTRTAINSVTTFLKKPIPFVFQKEKLENESKSYEIDILHHTRSVHHGIPAKVPPRSKQGQHDSNHVSNSRKRIDITEIIKEEMTGDELVQT